jgi:hypothetical protein
MRTNVEALEHARWRPPENSTSVLERGLELLVFGGVFGEIHFASRAKSADAELKRESDKQVAESNRLGLKQT